MSTAPETPVLQRSMGLRDVALFMITAGASPQWAATAAAAGPSSLVVWILGGIGMFLPLSVCVVFLGSRYPEEGGMYAWAKRAFGPLGGFLTGWTYWISNIPFLTGLLYFAAGAALYLTGRPDETASASPAYFVGFSLVALALALAMNLRGLGTAKWLNNASAVARWLEMLLLVGLGLAIWSQFGPAVPLTRETMLPGFELKDWLFWGAIAFAWTGPEAASFMGGEIREPRRTIPRALALAAPAIAMIYILSTIALIVSVDPSQLSALYGVMEAIRISAERLGLGWLVPIGAALVILDRVGGFGLWLGVNARIPFSAGIDHFLPASFSRVHPRYGSPVVALWFMGAIIAVLIFLGQAGTSVRGAYNVLVNLMVLATMLPFLALFASAIRLSGEPAEPGETRIPGGKYTVRAMATLGLLTTSAAMVLALVPAADEANPLLAVGKVGGTTVVLVAIGLLIYRSGVRRAAAAGRTA
ncbi:MAG: APC family permease [Gammaproteobacteria bacterium]